MCATPYTANADLAPSPGTPTQRGQYMARVGANVPLCLEHGRLTLRLPAFPPTGPGQFLQVACRPADVAPAEPSHELRAGGLTPWASPNDYLAQRTALLRRPFSLAGRRDTARGVELDLIYRVVGVGTAWLAELKPEDDVSIIGPLGNRFAFPAADGVAILVGGGVGIPPMLYLAEALADRGAVAFCGAQRRDLLPLQTVADAPRQGRESTEPSMQVAEFARHGIPAVVTTDDGSWGYHGLVTDALERFVDAHFADSTARSRVTIYTCGPEAMMKRVAAIALGRGIECQVSVERAMACGMGTCQSCVIRVRNPGGGAERPWVYKLACTDGPIFAASDLLW